MLNIMLAGPRYDYDHKQYTVWGQYNAMHDIAYADQWFSLFFTCMVTFLCWSSIKRLVEVMRMELLAVTSFKPPIATPILLLQVNVFGQTTP